MAFLSAKGTIQVYEEEVIRKVAVVPGNIPVFDTDNKIMDSGIPAIDAVLPPVTSVFGRTGAVVQVSGDYNTGQVTESGNLYFTNARAIAAPLTGYVSGAGVISAADTVLSAIQKLNGNIAGINVSSKATIGGTDTTSTTYLLGTASAYGVSLVTNGTNRFTIDSSGNAVLAGSTTTLTAPIVKTLDYDGVTVRTSLSPSGTTSNTLVLASGWTNLSNATINAFTGQNTFSSASGTQFYSVYVGNNGTSTYYSALSSTASGVLTLGSSGNFTTITAPAIFQTNAVYLNTSGTTYVGALTVSGSKLIVGAGVFSSGIGFNQQVLSSFGNMTYGPGVNAIFDTATGSKFGTATNQKLGFWNATPVIQQTTGITAAAFVANTSGTVNDSATWGGYTIGQAVAALRLIGILA